MHETPDHDLTAAAALFDTPDDELADAEAALADCMVELEAVFHDVPEPTLEEVAHIAALVPRPRTTAKETVYTGPSERITIRIATNTLKRIKAAAKAKRMPYQTLINSLLAGAV